MKKIGLVLLMVFFLSGCGTLATQSEFYEHDSVYKDWGHFLFSWGKYKEPFSLETIEEAERNGWWGMPVEGELKTE
jgi:hypothetical protein